MPIRWKVVDNYRRSIAVTGVLERQYNEGSIVKADPRTMGLMTFRTKKDAKAFSFGGLILKVQGIGKGLKPRLLSPDAYHSHLILDWYSSHLDGLSPPKGTICYKSVKVLE